MSVGKAYLVPNPEEFPPSVNDMMGLTQSTPMMSSVQPMRGEAAAAPVQYIGTYPIFQGDRTFLTWSTACSQGL